MQRRLPDWFNDGNEEIQARINSLSNQHEKQATEEVWAKYLKFLQMYDESLTFGEFWYMY